MVATWNVNSLRRRWDRLTAWLADKRPDVLCLQEIKMQDADFPALELHGVGYHAVAHGQKTYNGVAILSRIEHGSPTDVQCGMQDGDPDTESRLLMATIPGLKLRVGSVYVPNGQSVGADKYDYKLRWLKRFRSYLDRECVPSQSLVLCGDYNIAPADHDVHDPEVWRDTVICHPDARSALQAILDFGLVAERALEATRLQQENEGLRRRLPDLQEPIGQSRAMQELRSQIERAWPRTEARPASATSQSSSSGDNPAP